MLLADLKVTHCPACDREVTSSKTIPNRCYVCGRENAEENVLAGANEKRLDFELDQLNGELVETGELISVLAKEVSDLSIAHSRIGERISRVSATLHPIQSAAAAIMPPDLSIYDMETGRLPRAASSNSTASRQALGRGKCSLRRLTRSRKR